LKTPIQFVVSPNHPLFQEGDVTVEKLAAAKWALPKVPQRFMDQIPEEYESWLLPRVTPHYQIENPLTCLNLAKAGLVITATAQVLVEKDIAEGSLVAIPLPFEITTDIALYRLRSRTLTSSVRNVIRHLSAAC
ncbi:MAG: substrate-binding domain-containing protein, partial [Pseudomonadales bacterium]|nr:substrate-binding domain-containing protein [Pseudomonadales bacterium]